MVTNDMVNHPSHYTFGKYEVIEVIEDWKLGFHEANVVKYVARAKHKGKELEDLKKARTYLDRKIRLLEKAIENGTASEKGCNKDIVVMINESLKK